MKKENHHPRGRGRKFWVLCFFGLLFFCMLCYMLCKLNEIKEQISEVDVCCEPFAVSEEICNESFEVERESKRIIVHQPYYCSQVVVLFKPGFDKTKSEAYLRDSLGLEKVKECPNCDSIDIELWGRDGEIIIKPEEREKIAKGKLPPESDGKGILTSFNIIIKSPISSDITMVDIDSSSINPNESFFRSTNPSKNKILVALIDSGVDFENNNNLKKFEWRNEFEFSNNNSDEDKNCIKDDIVGYDFINNDVVVEDIGGHGTHIAGLIAKRRWNDVSANLQIMNLKIFNGGDGTLFNLACALQYAITKKANIINLSMGFYAEYPPQVLDTLLTIAGARDILVVTSSGNTGIDNSSLTNQHYPSDFNKDMMLSSAALIKGDTNLWEKSNYGYSLVDFATEGEDVESTYLNGDFAKLSGTSMAAGNTTGIAVSLMLQNGFNTIQTRDEILNMAGSNKIVSPQTDKPTVGMEQNKIARLIFN